MRNDYILVKNSYTKSFKPPISHQSVDLLLLENKVSIIYIDVIILHHNNLNNNENYGQKKRPIAQRQAFF